MEKKLIFYSLSIALFCGYAVAAENSGDGSGDGAIDLAPKIKDKTAVLRRLDFSKGTFDDSAPLSLPEFKILTQHVNDTYRKDQFATTLTNAPTTGKAILAVQALLLHAPATARCSKKSLKNKKKLMYGHLATLVGAENVNNYLFNMAGDSSDDEAKEPKRDFMRGAYYDAKAKGAAIAAIPTRLTELDGLIPIKKARFDALRSKLAALTLEISQLEYDREMLPMARNLAQQKKGFAEERMKQQLSRLKEQKNGTQTEIDRLTTERPKLILDNDIKTNESAMVVARTNLANIETAITTVTTDLHKAAGTATALGNFAARFGWGYTDPTITSDTK